MLLGLAAPAAGQADPAARDGSESSRDAGGTAAPSEAIDGRLIIDDLRFHVREWGDPADPAVLILHGITGHSWEFDGVAAALADRFHVIVLDQRGHGESTWAGNYVIDVMVDDVAAVMDALGLDRVRLIGHSMGGVHGWHFAARHPDRVEQLVIVDIDPDVITGDAIVTAMSDRLRRYGRDRFDDPEDAVREYQSRHSSSPPDLIRDFVVRNLVQSGDGTWSWRFDGANLPEWMSDAASKADAHWSALRRVEAPTLIIRGGDSSLTLASSADRMTREMSSARWVDVPGADHDVHIDQLETFIRELRAFLQP